MSSPLYPSSPPSVAPGLVLRLQPPLGGWSLNLGFTPASHRSFTPISPATTDLASSAIFSFLKNTLANSSSNSLFPPLSALFRNRPSNTSGLTWPHATKFFAARSMPMVDGLFSRRRARNVLSIFKISIVFLTSGLSVAVPRMRTAMITCSFADFANKLCHPVLLRYHIVGLHQGIEHCKRGRSKGRRGPVGSSPAILDPGQPKHLLRYLPSDKPKSSRAWKNMHSYTATLPDNAEWYGVGSAATAFPASTSTAHGDNVQLCLYSPLVDGSAHLPGLSLSNANVTIAVPDSYDSSESRSFASVSLFLDETNP